MITIATTPAKSRGAASPGTHVTVELRGELDMDGTAIIEPTLSALARSGPAELRLDLSALAFCDTSGISLFLRLHHRCARAHTTLVLTGIGGQPARVIRLVRLHRTIVCRFTVPRTPRRGAPGVAGASPSSPRRRTRGRLCSDLIPDGVGPPLIARESRSAVGPPTLPEVVGADVVRDLPDATSWRSASRRGIGSAARPTARA
ncbi:STAS domain-containing protein [Embleya sp. NPDC005575]|uniref:STAS domain-containing protein n=1 Tax=Embleya sp. NPDC005575 TaxID=3156892 RepID=UPI0033A946D8